ncbi:MAG: formimidoylglutamase [Bacteroidales bacterium]|nr:formimidoylglutamase [Bacteroidales bacterium]
MKDLHLYFEPVNKELFSKEFENGQIGSSVDFHFKNEFPDVCNCQIVILGVPENRNSVSEKDSSFFADAVRPFFYNLYNHFPNIKIADIGNLKTGLSVNDTYEAVGSILAKFIEKKIIPFIIGGSQDLTYANYLSYEKSDRIINILSIDPRIDIGKPDESINNNTWLNNIIFRNPNYLFNFSNIGYQSYFVDTEVVSLIKKLFFDATRLGVAKSNLAEIEPIVRNADVLSFDMSSIRMSDCPAATFNSPNGFSGEDACQIMRYAGKSEKISSLGLYELAPAFDINNISVRLVAQMIWYFIEGFSTRTGKNPHIDKSNMIKYIVSMHEIKSDITFYKNPITEKWWMEVPCPKNLFSKFERHYMVPCSYKDYEEAMKENIPDRWWQTFQKFM